MGKRRELAGRVPGGGRSGGSLGRFAVGGSLGLNRLACTYPFPKQRMGRQPVTYPGTQTDIQTGQTNKEISNQRAQNPTCPEVQCPCLARPRSDKAFNANLTVALCFYFWLFYWSHQFPLVSQCHR